MDERKLTEEAKKKYHELYPGFQFFGNITLITIALISLVLIGLNSGYIIDLGTRDVFVILVLIVSVGVLIYRLGQYTGFLDGYEIGHKK